MEAVQLLSQKKKKNEKMIPFRSGRENKKMFYVRLTTG
jgi:hypothetical protein